jgi:uncharacterized membrane protein YukC|eukprot:evm.model.NODE_45902_length_17556_cov_67.906128.1
MLSSGFIAFRRTLSPAILSLRSTHGSAAAFRFLLQQHEHRHSSTTTSGSSYSDTIISTSSLSPEGYQKLQQQENELDRMEEELEREAEEKKAGREGTREEGQEEDDMGEKTRKKASDRVNYNK